MIDTETIRDPFLNKDVEISTRLTDRLRGKYANGPTMPNGEPEFGWRQFEPVPIQRQAADEIDHITAERDALVMEAQACMGLLEDVPGDGFGARVQKLVVDYIAQRKALADLLDLCLTLGDFKNGVTHNCTDEGEVHASGIFDQARAALASTAPVASDRSEDERDALRTALMRAHQFINPDSDPMGLTNRELMAEIEAILTSTSRVPSDDGVSAP